MRSSMTHCPRSDHVRLPRTAGGVISFVSVVREPRATVRRAGVAVLSTMEPLGDADELEGRRCAAAEKVRSFASVTEPKEHESAPVVLHACPVGAIVAV